MANITAEDVKKLREMTGVGIMDCKNALIESEGNFENAIDILRKKGQKVAMNRQDRAAKEGYVIGKVSGDNKKGIIVMLNCETDFVARNEEFVSFTNAIADKAFELNTADINQLKSLSIDGRTIEEKITDLIAKTGEKTELGAFELICAEKVIAYNHQGNRLATIVGFNKILDNLDKNGREIAMQIAAMSPVAVDKEDVTQDIINKEIEIGMELARQEGKPEAMLEKISQGRLNKFFQEYTLLNQAYTRDNKKTIRQFLAEIDEQLKVTGFKRVQISS